METPELLDRLVRRETLEMQDQVDNQVELEQRAKPDFLETLEQPELSEVLDRRGRVDLLEIQALPVQLVQSEPQVHPQFIFYFL